MADPRALLDPAFVRELEALRRRLQVTVQSGAGGEHAARRRGGSAEFQDHRPYAPGDDLRRVDWAAFARTGEPVLKLFRAEEDAVLRLLIDASASLAFGAPQKIEVARRVAAAIGYLGLAGGQRVQVLVARERAGQNAGRGLERVGVPRRGRDSLAALLRDLSEPLASGAADLGRALDTTLQRSARPGLLVVLSDFLDPGPVTGALSRACAAGHQVALVQVFAREELEPTYDGDVSLVDAETGAPIELSMDATAIDAYVTRLAGLIEELRSWARKHRASYVRITNDEPLEGVVRRFVARAVD
ncbi:MAG TPA: DUF58 domain-containing protein [Polyangiaceae bacterium]|jgi:uncharacterized protein (DUF58 family)|nr:DUF58 domain-containing protein [Polyangiaceae bacterium]